MANPAKAQDNIMEHDKIIFFRNFLFRAFIIGVVFALFYFFITYAFWNTWVPWVSSFFKVDEKELGRMALGFFMILRIVLIFLFSGAGLGLTLDGKKEAMIVFNESIVHSPNNSPEPPPIRAVSPHSRLTVMAARLSFCR